jgi:hypothetical protein
MSSLIAYTEKEQVLVATDTLATSPKGEPAFFTTKAFILPHLQMIMAGTGISGFLGKWFLQANGQMLVRGIDHLNYHTPGALISIWNSLRDEYPIPDDVTTTVYHFGFSEEDGTIHTFVYRSTNKFMSEILPYSIIVKPKCEVAENPIFPFCITQMMEEQRIIQNSLPENERVYIGGRIQIHHLTKEGTNIYTLSQFEDYESVRKKMYENFDSKNRVSQGSEIFKR